MKLYRAIAQQIERYSRNLDTAPQWADDAESRIDELARDFLPSGSGFDSGCRIELDQSRIDKIVIRCDFHHMNDAGYYDGWTSHRAIVTPSLQSGFDLRITGKDKRGIREYIADCIHNALKEEIDQ